ncbi:AAA family ATPase (plasmid) [Arthrobacter sp. D3-18]
MSDSNGIRLTSVRASKVLYEYDHFIQFDNANEFVIIYGPNGIGKTKFLEIIDALSKLQSSRLLRMPFESATLAYSDGTRLEAILTQTHANEEGDDKISLTVTLYRPGFDPVDWTTTTDESTEFESFLLRNTSWIRVGPDLWRDRTDGEIAETEDLEHRFGSRQIGRSRRGTKQGPPVEMQDFSTGLHTHLIETQRLKIEEYLDRNSRIHSGRSSRPQTTIVEYANQMQKLLADALADNSKITQQLDRTFPNRMLTQRVTPVRSEDELRQEYESQNRFRSRLAEIALIGLAAELSLPPRELEPYELSMLELYLSDADQKLHSFEALLSKIELLERIINSRLLGKKLHINALQGLAVRHDNGRDIDLDALSSGEQHEIILMYGLLFNVEAGSLVMIDEPEISLHISWQINFINDVREIANLSGFQFIVATHSPQIINNWWSHAVQLGPENIEL